MPVSAYLLLAAVSPCLLVTPVLAGEARSFHTGQFHYLRCFPATGSNPTGDDSPVDSPADPSASQSSDDELYDLRADPHQQTNVAADPAYASTRLRLRRELTALLIRTGDPCVAVIGYQSRDIEGWPVRVGDALLEQQPEATEKALKLLTDQLQRVREMLPAESLALVRTVPIWLSPEYEGVRPTGEYHPGADWLAGQGRRPELHQCVEFTTIPRFEQEIQRMPVMVLHELAHAYHDQVLGFDNAEIKGAYERVKQSGAYDAVQRSNGNTERAYAMATPMEYFAETSEALFGVNDFYPFNREELERHDPEMAALLRRLWKVSDDKAP